MQAPPTQVAPSRHTAPSSHGVPSGTAGFEHIPEVESHTPAAWHGSDAVHVVGLPLVQAPLIQVSPKVHALPSLHPLPSGAAGFEHAPVPWSQAPAVWH